MVGFIGDERVNGFGSQVGKPPLSWETYWSRLSCKPPRFGGACAELALTVRVCSGCSAPDANFETVKLGFAEHLHKYIQRHAQSKMTTQFKELAVFIHKNQFTSHNRPHNHSP